MLAVPLAGGRVVGGTGASGNAYGCAPARTSAGLYTLTLDQQVDSTNCEISVTPIGATPLMVAVAHTSDTVKTVRISAGDGTPTDSDFHFCVSQLDGG